MDGSGKKRDKVSIHTSAWEVTEFKSVVTTVITVSIHTSAWEVTAQICLSAL